MASFASASGIYDTQKRDAGPRDDGTLDGAKIADNLERIDGGDGASMVSQWLYEYASFAVFIAEPLLRLGTFLGPDGEPQSVESAAVSRAVAELLKPLAPE